MKEAKKLVVLVDTHAILHRGYHALPDFRSSKNEPTGAIYGLIVFLLKIIKDTNPHAIIACYDLPGATHRHDAFAEYKGTRKKVDDDLIFQIKESSAVLHAFGIPVVSAPGFEADDCLGTLVEKLKQDDSLDILIASGDMDTFQLISGKKVRVYTLKKGIKDTIVYDEDMVKERFGFGPELLPDYKGLRGDVSDNIPGIKGIGEKTASDIISKFGTIEEIYIALKKDKGAFEKAGIKKRMIELLEAGEEEAFFSKMLATIRRDAPVSATIPEEAWHAHVDATKLKDLCARFEFRDLPRRIDEVVKTANGKEVTKADYPVIMENIPEDELIKAGLALFLLDSDKTNPTLEDILSYTGKGRFAEAKESLISEIEKSGLSKVYYEIEVPLVPVIHEMRETGIAIDRKYLAGLSKEYHTELSALEKKIYAEAGTEFNINSPKQLGEILFTKMGLAPEKQKKTAGGAVSTRESELLKIKDLHPIVPAILEYREIQKILSTYVDSIPEFIDVHGRIHPTLIQAGAVTGRMASENPSIQNIPIQSERGKKIRNAFTVKEGNVLLDVDYSQVELRIAAFLSGDTELIEIFKSGRDIHTEVAAKVFGIPRESVDKEMRRRAKVINFGILYGMGVTALRENLTSGGSEVTRAEAEKFRDDYFKTFGALAAWIKTTVDNARECGYTETFFGRRRYFRDLKSKLPFMRAMAERMAVNAPIQGTQADMLKIAMKRISDTLKERGFSDKAKLLFQVHDELGLEVEQGVVKEVAQIVKETMEGVLTREETKGIPIIANVGIGKNWGNIEPLDLK